MKIKSSAALFVTLCVAASGQTALAQTGATSPASATTSATAATPTGNAGNANANPNAAGANNVKGNFEFDALGFKGSLHFDGNPLSILQQPSQPAQNSQPAAGGAMPVQSQMVAPGQPMPMMQPGMQQVPMMQQGMQQVPMMQQGMQQVPMMQQYPMQQMPVQGAVPMQMQQMPMQGMPMQQSMMMPMQGSPMQVMQTVPVTPAAAQQPAPGAPLIDLSGVAKAASAIAPTVIKALPSLGLPAAPAFIDQSSKVIQKMFPGQTQPVMPNPAMTPMAATQPMMPVAPNTMPMGSAPANASVDVLNALDQFQRAVKYNLEMAQEAAYLAGFGDPAMRATSALEAQKNANEARETAERANNMAGNFGGEAAQLLASIRDGAARTQAFADQARAASNNSNGLSP